MYKRLYMGSIDSLLVKYGATICGYSIVGIPVFSRTS
jgi:ATP-binding cassette subfamily D (ALD) protein 3